MALGDRRVAVEDGPEDVVRQGEQRDVRQQQAAEHDDLAKLHFSIIDPLIPKDMFRLVCLVKLVFFAREGVAF